METNIKKNQRLHIHARHLARLDQHLVRMARENQRLSWMRLGAFVGGTAVTFAAFQIGGGVGWLVGWLALIGFGILVGRHRRLDRVRRDFGIARMMTARQIARMQLDWAGIPRVDTHGVETHADDASPLARDLTLTGDRSLLQLLDTAFSRGGTDRLRGWLLDPGPDPRVIRARQALVSEIIPLTGFRAHLGQASARVRSSDHPWNGERLKQWLESHRGVHSLRLGLWVLFPFALLNVTLFGLALAGILPPFWMGGVAVYLLVYFSWQSTLRDLFGDAAYLRDALTEFAAVSQFLERYPHPAGVARVCAPFLRSDERRSFGEAGGVQGDRLRNAVRDERPSKLLRGVIGVASAASLQRNPFIWLPLNLLVPWDLFFAFRLEGMKARLRVLLPVWLDAWYELEALNSLANFAYLTGAVFPTVEVDGPVLEAEGVGHPLIPEGVRVTNDFSLAELGEVVVITGSNMSGKSTFLRTLGVNLALAYAGGPVLARRLRVRPMRVGTSIQVSDSLADGLSYFYAEVKRLKGLLDALRETEALPLFFLIDELFRGTNNEERRKGSEAYVRALAGGHGAGLVSTHDLELTHLAETIPGVSNFHFREEITDGRMVFDYRLHSGPCPTTNALKIMALEGLPVGEGEV